MEINYICLLPQTLNKPEFGIGKGVTFNLMLKIGK
jgi:hypothetical protein